MIRLNQVRCWARPIFLAHRRLRQEDHKCRPAWARISKYQRTNKITNLLFSGSAVLQWSIYPECTGTSKLNPHQEEREGERKDLGEGRKGISGRELTVLKAEENRTRETLDGHLR